MINGDASVKTRLLSRLIALVGAGLVQISLPLPAQAAEHEPSIAELRAVYAAPPSKFVMVDGVNLHVRDEGAGPVVVMLNGHMGNLHMYDAWAASLVGAGFRVVRFDWPPYGLSLPDPAGVYSTDRATQLLADLLDQMKLAKVSLVGTSNGATVVAHYASLHPDRVERIAVSTLPLGKPGPRKSSDALITQGALYGKADYKPESFWRAVLEDIFYDKNNVTPAMVKMYTDMNNYPGGYAAVNDYIAQNIAMYKADVQPALYAKLTSPMLIQWGDGGTVLSPIDAEKGAAAFPNAKLMLIIHYPHSGHMPMLEEPGATGKDLIAFLKGRSDAAALPPPRKY